jgi:hypothetical protein
MSATYFPFEDDDNVPPPPPRRPAQPHATGPDPDTLLSAARTSFKGSAKARTWAIVAAIVVVIGVAGLIFGKHSSGVSKADQSAFMSICSSDYAQNTCQCALGNGEKAMSASLFHQAVSEPADYQPQLVATLRGCPA